MKKFLIILFCLGICQVAFSQVCGNIGLTGGASLQHDKSGGTCGIFGSFEVKCLRFEAECGWSRVDFADIADAPHDDILYISPSVGFVIGDDCRIVTMLGATNWKGTDKENQMVKTLISPKIKIGGEVSLASFLYFNVSWSAIIPPNADIIFHTNNFLTMSIGIRL